MDINWILIGRRTTTKIKQPFFYSAKSDKEVLILYDFQATPPYPGGTLEMNAEEGKWKSSLSSVAL